MRTFNVLTCAFSVVTVSLAACSAEPPTSEENAPDIEIADLLDEQDQGSTWNGWSHGAGGQYIGGPGGPIFWSSSMTRTSGDLTRGGGACLVYWRNANPSSCTTDAQCVTAAQTQFGPSAWGYCLANYCLSRPGSQAAFCVQNPNRSPGSVSGPAATFTVYPGHTMPSAYHCMTKTAGPNTACGGTNPSLYIRETGAIVQMQF
jgi:hypothetical protein